MKEPIRDARRQTIGYMDRQSNGKCTIYDKMYRRIGEIRPNGSKLEAFDHMNRRLGSWDERTDTTFDKMNRRMGKGNLLMNFYFE